MKCVYSTILTSFVFKYFVVFKAFSRQRGAIKDVSRKIVFTTTSVFPTF